MEDEWKNIFFPFNKNNNFSDFLSLFSNKNSQSNYFIDFNDWILIWQSLARVNYSLCYEAFLYIGHHIPINKFFNFYKRNQIDYHYPLISKALKICVISENAQNLVIILIINIINLLFYYFIKFFSIILLIYCIFIY
jgi:hypothetical protein